MARLHKRCSFIHPLALPGAEDEKPTGVERLPTAMAATREARGVLLALTPAPSVVECAGAGCWAGTSTGYRPPRGVRGDDRSQLLDGQLLTRPVRIRGAVALCEAHPELRCVHCGERLAAPELKIRPGPGANTAQCAERSYPSTPEPRRVGGAQTASMLWPSGSRTYAL